MPDHVHLLISIPRKYAVSQVVGFIKSAIHLARVYGERKRNFVGQPFWASGYFVNTVGRNEEAIRTYICNHEKGRSAVRSTRPLALTPLGVQDIWGRVSDPIYRLGRFMT